MDILEWAKANAKEDANMAELEELVERANPINKVQSQAEAEVLINNTKQLKSYFDSYVSRAVENHDTKFKENKLPEILKEEREKLRKELNPEETEEQKQLREIRDELKQEKNLRALEMKRSELRTKGKDFGIPEKISERFAAFGDDSELALSQVGEFIQTSIQDGIESGVKDKFKGRKAPESGAKDNANAKSREAFDNMSPKERMKAVRSGASFID